MKINYFIVSIFLLSTIFIPFVNAGNVTNNSNWEIELNNDGTCSFGKTYEFGSRDAVIVAITSYGQVSILADKEFTGNVVIDGKNIIRPTNSISGSTHMYSNSDNIENGKLFISYFKSGNKAKIKLKNGKTRELSLRGFTKGYKKYRKCAR